MGVASRADLNYIFKEAMGKLSVGHLFAGGREGPEVKNIPVGCWARTTKSRAAGTAFPTSTTAKTGTRNCTRR